MTRSSSQGEIVQFMLCARGRLSCREVADPESIIECASCMIQRASSRVCVFCMIQSVSECNRRLTNNVSKIKTTNKRLTCYSALELIAVTEGSQCQCCINESCWLLFFAQYTWLGPLYFNSSKRTKHPHDDGMPPCFMPLTYLLAWP